MNMRKFQKLSDIDHVIKRPGMYIGSIKPHTSKKFLFIEDKKRNKKPRQRGKV